MTAAAANERKRRPRRVASDEAHAWARNLLLGNPYAKSVLMALAGYVNGDGICFVGIEQLHEDTDLSTDTVRKRLAWLEQIGAIIRLPQWIDANGRRNGDGKGKRTSDEIRLLINADPDDIEARARGDLDGGDGAEVSPRSQQGLNQEPDSAGPLPALGQPSDSGKGPESSSEPEPDSPPHPPPGGETATDGDEKEWAGSDTWPEFERAWQEPILRQSIARQVWSGLTVDERAIAIKAARGYVAWRARQKKPPNVINAHTFLREREAWAGFAAQAPADVVAPPETVMITADSRAWRGLCVVKWICRSPVPEGDVEVRGSSVAYLESLAELYCHGGLWRALMLPDYQKQTKAWEDRLARCGFRMPPSERIETGETHPTLGRVWRSGWHLPIEWPPRMDGSFGPQSQEQGQGNDADADR